MERKLRAKARFGRDVFGRDGLAGLNMTSINGVIDEIKQWYVKML